MTGTSRPAVAIVGMAVLLPGAPDLATYWHNLHTGVDAVGPVPDGRHDPAFHAAGPAGPERTYCHRGGFVDPELALDPSRLGIMPASVPGMEPDQLVALGVATSAIADAGGADALGDPSRVGIVLGRGGYLSPGLSRFSQRVRVLPQVLRTVRELVPDLDDAAADRLREALEGQLGPFAPESTIGLVPNLAASRVANRLDLRGPAYTVDAACASSLVAVDHAMSELATGRCDTVLAGGVHHCHDETLWATFTQLGALSPTGRIAPFSTEADGLVIGEGSGMVVLKRLADAERAGDRVYAVITGVGTASDGRTASLFAPDENGQVAAVRSAWAEAGIDPAEPGSVGLVEAHGTATRAGDDTELATLATVFGPRTDGDAPVVGSVKSMIGHTMPTAGVAALVKAALAVHHGVLPPTLHCEQPNPLLDRTRFRVLDTAADWPDGPRRAGVNAFGFGGINAHVVLEQAPERTARVTVTEPERVLRLAADSPAGLRDLLDRPDRELARLPVGDGTSRLGVVDPDERRLAAARKIVARAAGGGPGSWTGRNDVWLSTDPMLRTGGTAFVFPGLEAEFEPRCADVAAHLGLPVPETSGHGDLFAHAGGVMAVSRLLVAALRHAGITPDALAGHSVGEWSAMAAAGMFGGIDPMARHDEFWPSGFPVPDVVFAALGCSAESAATRIGSATDVVVSHDNAPRQSVVCGTADAVERLVDACRADGVVARVLPFRSGFHTPMFEPLTTPFARLATALPMDPPRVPVWSATTVAPFSTEPNVVRETYLRHLVEPVRFRPLVEAMYAAGSRLFVVMGPGQVGSYVSDTLAGRPHAVVAANSPLREGLAQLRRVATASWVEGGPGDIDALTPASGDFRHGESCVPVRRVASSGTVRLQLGTPPLALDAAVARELLPTRTPAPAARPAGADRQLSPLVADELAALLAETERATASVLVAAAAGPRLPAPPSPRVDPTGPDERTAVLDVSLDALPYLRGHRFFRQRADWPDEADRRPVVPATTILAIACQEVERAWPGVPVTGIRDARFDRWLIAEPAQRVELRMRRVSAEAVEVRFGEFARLTVCTGLAVPLGAPPRLGAESTPPTSAAEVYSGRTMFHGPQFQGLTAVHGIGRDHIRGTITAPAAPGALLDNVGQLLGVWLFAHHDTGLLAFPQRIAQIDFAGPLPPAGSDVETFVHGIASTPESMTMDAHLVHEGRVTAAIRGWRDIRLECDRDAHRTYAFPDTTHLGVPRAGGWVLVRDRWPSTAARDIHAGVHLGTDERARYGELAPRRAQQWLLGRIAAKDAVRHLLGCHLLDQRPRFPAEIEIGNDEAGRPFARGRHGVLPPVEISLAHSGPYGVALAGPPGSAPGIDVEQVREPSPGTLDAALAPAERALLDQLGADRQALWFTRFWAAKEAVGKAVGSGLAGAPRRIQVLAADEHRLRVRTPDGAEHTVDHTAEHPETTGPAYVIAWTGGSTHEETR